MTQILADAYGCDARIEDPQALCSAAEAAAAAVGATIVGEREVHYVPHGLTVAIFLAESHIVLTTWPEYKLLLIDILLCTPEQNVDVALAEIVARLCSTGEVVRHEVRRMIATRPHR